MSVPQHEAPLEVYLNDSNLLKEVCHRLYGVVITQALHKDGVIVRVVLVVHCGVTKGEGQKIRQRSEAHRELCCEMKLYGLDLDSHQPFLTVTL